MRRHLIRRRTMALRLVTFLTWRRKKGGCILGFGFAAFPEGGEVAAMDFVDALSSQPGEDFGGGLVLVFHPGQLFGVRFQEVQL